MLIKCFEIRDSMTTIPALALQLSPHNESQRKILARGGYGRRAEEHQGYILLVKLTDLEAQFDPFKWSSGASRTMPEAHRYIKKYWETLLDGDIVDIEFILGETKEKKASDLL